MDSALDEWIKLYNKDIEDAWYSTTESIDRKICNMLIKAIQNLFERIHINNKITLKIHEQQLNSQKSEAVTLNEEKENTHNGGHIEITSPEVFIFSNSPVLNDTTNIDDIEKQSSDEGTIYNTSPKINRLKTKPRLRKSKRSIIGYSALKSLNVTPTINRHDDIIDSTIIEKTPDVQNIRRISNSKIHDRLKRGRSKKLISNPISTQDITNTIKNKNSSIDATYCPEEQQVIYRLPKQSKVSTGQAKKLDPLSVNPPILNSTETSSTINMKHNIEESNSDCKQLQFNSKKLPIEDKEISRLDDSIAVDIYSEDSSTDATYCAQELVNKILSSPISVSSGISSNKSMEDQPSVNFPTSYSNMEVDEPPTEMKIDIKDTKLEKHKKIEKEQPNFVYKEPTVRGKERLKLEGWDCAGCEKFYIAMGYSPEEVKKLLNKCSRHRSKFKPNDFTPKDLWKMDFPPTQD